MKEDAQVQLDIQGARPRPSIRLHNMLIMKHIQRIIASVNIIIIVIIATTMRCSRGSSIPVESVCIGIILFSRSWQANVPKTKHCR